MLDERLEARDERKNVIASVAKHSVIVLFVVIFFSACTDYVSQIEDRYGEWGTSSDIPFSSSWSVATGFSSSAAKSSSSVALPTSSDKVIKPTEVTVGIMTDSRDAQAYKTVKIGSQVWMAQNLNYKTSNSYCHNDDLANCTKYGRLYTWAAAMDSAGTWSTNGKGCGYGSKCSSTGTIRGICSSGWHLPSQTEWNTLFTAVGGSSTAGKVLKSISGWYNSGNSTDAFSFSVLPAGYWDYNGSYGGDGYGAYFWSSTGLSLDAYSVILDYNRDNVRLDSYNKRDGFSVRCVKD